MFKPKVIDIFSTIGYQGVILVQKGYYEGPTPEYLKCKKVTTSKCYLSVVVGPTPECLSAKRSPHLDVNTGGDTPEGLKCKNVTTPGCIQLNH